jgi:CRISPR system Cascade subunit CasA
MDTLIFCLVHQNREVMQYDLPIWEKEPESLDYLKGKVKVADKKSGKEKDRAVERTATGIVDLYTWRSRSILFDMTSNDGITNLGFASGIGLKESAEIDPMLAYNLVEVTDEETKEKVKVRAAIQFEEKGVWRDFDSLLPDREQLAPKVIENAVSLSKLDRDRFPRGVMVLGQKYFPPRPNIAYWRAELFALPESILSDRNLKHDIHEILLDAQKAGDALNMSCELYAKNILCHGDRKVEKKDIRNFIEQMSALPYFWSTLEVCFHDVLNEYTLESDSQDVRCRWLGFVRKVLNDAWSQQNAAISTGDTWGTCAFVKSEKAVGDKLKELDKLITQLKP